MIVSVRRFSRPVRCHDSRFIAQLADMPVTLGDIVDEHSFSDKICSSDDRPVSEKQSKNDAEKLSVRKWISPRERRSKRLITMGRWSETLDQEETSSDPITSYQSLQTIYPCRVMNSSWAGWSMLEPTTQREFFLPRGSGVVEIVWLGRPENGN
jgi:hypothetical protein